METLAQSEGVGKGRVEEALAPKYTFLQHGWSLSPRSENCYRRIDLADFRYDYHPTSPPGVGRGEASVGKGIALSKFRSPKPSQSHRELP
jgi:hypothetical protein